MRNIPEAIPKSLPGATFITAELFAGMNAPAPSPFSTAATVTTRERGRGRELGVNAQRKHFDTEADRRRPDSAKPVGEPAADGSDDAAHEVPGDEEQRRIERREVTNALEVHEDQEQHGEVREALEQRGEKCGGERRDPEEPQVDHRCVAVVLDDHEDDQNGDATHEGRKQRAGEFRRREFRHRPEHAEKSCAEKTHPDEVETLPLHADRGRGEP